MFPFLKKIVEQSDTKAGRAFDLVIQSIIVVSLVSLTIDTLPDLAPQTKRLLGVIEVVTVGIFTVEYILRIAVADQKLKYIFSFMGIIDFIAVLPFYLGLDLRAVRILRLARVFRALKLVRYNRAIQRFGNAFYSIREELAVFLTATIFLVYLASVGIYYFENEAQPDKFGSIFHSFWWAIVTFTTVGYGDVFPITIGGRLFTGLILLLGIGVIAVPSGLFASALTRIDGEEMRDK